MIHVAPCSCELHVEIRRLKAELAQRRKTGFETAKIMDSMEAELRTLREGTTFYSSKYEEERARAEKAEARFAEWEAHPLRSPSDERYWYTRFKAEQARVAELERLSDKVAQAIMLHDPVGEARERLYTERLHSSMDNKPEKAEADNAWMIRTLEQCQARVAELSLNRRDSLDGEEGEEAD